MAATAPATSWSGVIKQRKMHTTKQLVSSSSPARLPQSVANPQDPYIQMSKVLQTDGSNRACNLMIWLHQATQEAYHQAASQLVFTCTVAAICCKSSRSIHSNVKGLANRWQQPRLQPHGLASSSNDRCILPSSYSASLHLHGCRNLLQILKIHTFKCQRSCKQMAATAPATSWSGVIKQRKMHTTKQLVS